MSLLDIFRSALGMAKDKVDKHVCLGTYVKFDAPHVHMQPSFELQQATAGEHYFRLRLSQMLLEKEVAVAAAWYPAVQSLVRFQFGDQHVEIANVLDPSKIKNSSVTDGRIICRNITLTPAMPFHGGTIDLTLGLMGIQGENYLKNFIQVFSKFAGLLAVPQLSAALNVAQPLAYGIQELFAAGQGHFHLALLQSFAEQEMQSAFIAVIRETLPKPEPQQLWVVDHTLHEGQSPGQSKPYTRSDFMLFRIEVFQERDDWDQLTSIAEPLNDCRTALHNGDKERALYHIQTAFLRAKTIPELTRADRRRVVERLKDQYRQEVADFEFKGVTSGPEPSLGEMMKEAMPIPTALDMGELTWDEVFASPES